MTSTGGQSIKEAGVEYTHSAAGPAWAIWWKRENLVPGLALLVLMAVAWGYTLSQGDAMKGMAVPAATGTMANMERIDATKSTSAMIQPTDLGLFLFGWAVMMLAMMLPAALPLMLLYRTIARNRLRPMVAAGGMVALLAGYIGIWTLAGLPIYAYQLLTDVAGPILTVVPGLLLIAGGVYQFTALKQGCHTRCSNPLFFLMQKWRPGTMGAVRLGILHGIDCFGCCAGLMIALVALGMMNVAWMLTAAVIIFVEKTLPSGHRVARPLGLVLIVGGVVVLGASLLSGPMAM